MGIARAVVANIRASFRGGPFPRLAFAAAVFSTIVAGARAQVEAPGPAREVGKLGELPVTVGDVSLADTLVHQDVDGGSVQELQALAGAPGGGFVAVWRDHRDGMMGLYLRRMTAEGEPREPEQPIHAPHAGRRRDPAVALAPDGSGVVAWTSIAGRSTVFIRAFDARGAWRTDDVALPAPADDGGILEPQRVRQARSGGARRPALVRVADGHYGLAWIDDGRPAIQELDPAGVCIGLPRWLVAKSAEAEAGLWLVPSGASALCFWCGAGAWFQRSVAGGAFTNLGANPIQAAGSDGMGGTWLARGRIDGEQEFTDLVHLDADGRFHANDRPLALRSVPSPSLKSGAFASTALTSGAFGVAVVVEEQRAAGEPPTASLRFGPANSAVVVKNRELSGDAWPSAQRHGWLLADDGERVCIGWTQADGTDENVSARMLPLHPLDGVPMNFGPIRRLNSDVASADQSHGRIAAAGEHALVVWQDARSGYERSFLRRIDASGVEGREIELPVVDGERPTAARGMPEVAMHADGACAIVWRQANGSEETLHAQLLKPDASALTPDRALDPAQRTGGVSAAAIVALAGERGYVAAWPRPRAGLWCARLPLDGRAPSPPLALVTEGDAQDPALALLDDGRVLCAWDERVGGDASRARLCARFLDIDGVPIGEVLHFEASPFGIDWDPCVASAPDGGFVLAWTAGAPSDRGRDIYARRFDRDAKPGGPFLPLSTISNEQDWPTIARLADGSWLVAWEDDLSGYDEIHARRILPSGRALGRAVLVNELPSRSVPDRVLPSVAACGDGFLACWGDRRRSLGWDVFVKRAGARWDAPEAR